MAEAAPEDCEDDDADVLEGRCGWVFDDSVGVNTVGNVRVLSGRREVLFHPVGSAGTMAVRGTRAMTFGVHCWTVKMGPAVYGTDMMVGVCTKDFELTQSVRTYCSLLGCDSNSWGVSFRGPCWHDGQTLDNGKSSTPFRANSKVEIRLDLYAGSLSVSVDGQPFVVVVPCLWCEDRPKSPLYPAISSTAANSRMMLVRTMYCDDNLLQHICMIRILSTLSRRSHINELALPKWMREEMLRLWGCRDQEHSVW